MLKEKLFRISKIKNVFKNNNFLLICNNKTLKKSLTNKKSLKTNNYKVNNKILKITLNNSLFNQFFLINGSIKLLALPKIVTKLALIYYKFLSLILAFKFNNKIYCFTVLKKSYSLNYFQSKNILTQVCLLNLKKNLDSK